jgi:hypothetical protein
MKLIYVAMRNGNLIYNRTTSAHIRILLHVDHESYWQGSRSPQEDITRERKELVYQFGHNEARAHH